MTITPVRRGPVDGLTDGGVTYLPGSIPPTLFTPLTMSRLVLAVDPGQVAGWAAIAPESRACAMGECSSFALYASNLDVFDQIVIERTPHAIVRSHDTWPYRCAGAIEHKVWPRKPEWLAPSSVGVAERWYELSPVRGVSRHARDALAYLLFFLVTKAQKV